ncbi:T9SS type B sorting domain-containing protein [Aurantibacter sp.]|uniref:T9SS type B sorting domain-containing protein n=1 Tax=Aurantibacter sp. TaxID=2807103 RepID=UPI003264F56E
MKKYCLLIMLLVFAINYGQDETANWYFGNGAGLQFNNDGGVNILENSKISTEEGCASISDKNGSLLFYTDGITVYNRNHTVMLNGNRLYGDPSSTQSAIIVPAPTSDVIFFIFTVDTSIEEHDPDFGLNYSIVDLSEDNGNGAVTVKNINLLQTCSEKIAAVVKDCSKESVWVMTLSTEDGRDGLPNTFHAFEVNENGVNNNAVKSKFTTSFNDQRGYLKFSSDGKQMASANEFDGLFLYDFNSETGNASNPQRIIISALNKNPYSVEFSPNNQFLYVHTHSDAPALETNHNSNLLQYDLLSNNISQSEVVLDHSANYRGALQLGANGKIYRTITKSYLEGSSYLGVINNPDIKGTAANYQHNAIDLKNGIAMQGLPPFIQSFFAKTGLIKTADGTTSTSATFCTGDELILETEEIENATYIWEHDGSIIGDATTNMLQITEIDETNAGKYRLTISHSDATQCDIIGEAQINISEPPIANRASLVQCDIENENANSTSDGYTYFNLDQARNDISPNENNLVTFYRTLSDQENNSPIELTNEYRNESATNQIIYVKVTDVYGCTNETELALEVLPTSGGLEITKSYYTCGTDPLTSELSGVFDLQAIKQNDYDGFEVAFYNTTQDATLETNVIDENNYSTISTYLYARIESMNQCLGIELLEFIVNPAPIVNIDSEFLICTNNPDLSITAEQGFDSYGWYKIENTETLISNGINVEIIEPGEYRLEVGLSYNNGTQNCKTSKTFTVSPSNNAQINDIEIEDFQENNSINIIAIGDGDYEYSIESENGPYQENPIFENVIPGSLTIYVRDKNGCGITNEEISVLGFPKFFTPNGDGINESWNLIGLPENKSVELLIYDRYGKLLHQINQVKNEGWNGTFNGEFLPASDYWFRVNLEEGRTYQGHFTLKR